MLKFNIIHDDTSVEDIRNALTSAGIVINKEFANLKVMNVSAIDENAFTGFTFILQVEVDSSVNVTPSEEEPWHKLRLSTISLPLSDIYISANDGENAIVYLIDSGIDASHPQFASANITNLYSFDDTFDDYSGHGTSVASVIVGNTLGTAPSANLKVVKIQMGSEISISSLIEAFDAVLEDHNLTPSNAKVVNCSWVINKSLVLDTKIQELLDANLLVVAAAGNFGEAADNYSPVGLNTVLGVGASDAYDRVISWGDGALPNWGPEVDITAPGIDVDIADSSSGAYRTTSGTSIAAGITSGIACQWITMEPSFSAQTVQLAILGDATEDILFRNESVYETTPNKLLSGIFKARYIKTPRGTRFYAKRGTEVTFNIELYDNPVLHSVILDNQTSSGAYTRKSPDWVSQVSNTEFVMSPPPDTPVGIYNVQLLVLNNSGEVLGGSAINLVVYENDPSELDENLEYYVITSDENDNIIVMAQLCPANYCFSNFNCSIYGPTCLCSPLNECSGGKE